MHSWDRRSVLVGGAGLVGGALWPACRKSDAGPADAAAAPSGPVVETWEADVSIGEVMPVLIAVAEHLLPSDELGPGAREANVAGYLEHALADPRLRATKSTLTRGAVWLSRTARERYGRPFFALVPDEKEALLRPFADGSVRPTGFTPAAFLRMMLALTLEGFLGDPKYGGNRDGVGWAFVGGIDWAGRRG